MLLIFVSYSPVTAGKLTFSKDNTLALFHGPIVLDEVDNLLSQLMEKKPKIIAQNKYLKNLFMNFKNTSN